MKKITIKFLLLFYLLFICLQPVVLAKHDYNKYNPKTNPQTGIISYVQESYTDDAWSEKSQTQPVPIPANRKCYLDVKLYAYCDGWWSSASSKLYDRGTVIAKNNASWIGDVYHTNYSILTYAYHGAWGTSLARATVKIYPYFVANISVQNPNCGAIYVNNTSYRPDRNYEYKAGTSILLRAEANSGCAFIRWEGSVSSTSPTIDIMMNEDKTIRAVFADIHVDDVTSSDTPITYLGRDIRIEWSDVIDVSGIKEYQVMITETNQAPTNLNGLLTTLDSALVLKNLASKKSYYAWVRAVDNAGNISKNWLQIGPFSPASESSEFLACTPQAKIVNDQPYYEVGLSLKDVDAAKFIIQRRLVSSTEWLKKEFTSNELKASSFRYIDRDNLTKHASINTEFIQKTPWD